MLMAGEVTNSSCRRLAALQEVSASAGVRAMPTFQFYRSGSKINEMKGANPQGLEQMLGRLA